MSDEIAEVRKRVEAELEAYARELFSNDRWSGHHIDKDDYEKFLKSLQITREGAEYKVVARTSHTIRVYPMRSVRRGAAGGATAGGAVGGIGGATAGAIIGGILVPGFGHVLGGIIGAVAGAATGGATVSAVGAGIGAADSHNDTIIVTPQDIFKKLDPNPCVESTGYLSCKIQCRQRMN